MRSSKSRSRSKGNRNRSTVGNVVNRVFDSSGPDGKVRGTPQQIIEKYNQLARDAQLGNDRVATENFQQHAEHYLRMLSEAQREQDQRREQQERENRERQQQRDRDDNRAGDGRSGEPDAPQGQGGQGGQGQQPEAQDNRGQDNRGQDNRGQDNRGQGGDTQTSPRKRRNKPGGNGNGNGQGNDGGNGDATGGHGAEVVDLGGDDGGSHLVDTPENAEKPKPKRKPRRKPAESGEAGDDTTQPAAPPEDIANNS
ncbi:DUF4167 domain-containing protein [Roseivivax sp. CAU 1753]